MDIKLSANANTFTQSETVTFLMQEYNKCFDHLKHYDAVQNTLMTYSLTGYIAIISGLYTIFRNDTSILRNWFLIVVVILALFVGILVLSLSLKNRIYFVVTARQINSIRNYILNNSELNFIKYNKMYTGPKYPKAFSWGSTHFFYTLIVIVLNSFFIAAGILIYAHLIHGVVLQIAFNYGGIGMIVAIFLQIIISYKYLQNYS